MPGICKKCKSEVAQNYCPICGHPKDMTRIDGRYLIQEIYSVSSFDKGLLFTIRELVTNPGKSVLYFLREDRNRFVKPIVFLVVTSLIYKVFNNIFLFEDGYVKFSDNEGSATLSIFKWIQGNYGYANIIMAIFIAAWTKLFFRKREFNIFEILVLLCFVMGMGMLIYAVFGIIQSAMDFNVMQIAGLVGIIYLTWAIGEFYGKGKFINYAKAFFAYILGMLTFSITAVIIGAIIDLIG
ncbi:MAG: DUF3667 domain-containing protein [Sediminicola sp.]